MASGCDGIEHLLIPVPQGCMRLSALAVCASLSVQADPPDHHTWSPCFASSLSEPACHKPCGSSEQRSLLLSCVALDPTSKTSLIICSQNSETTATPIYPLSALPIYVNEATILSATQGPKLMPCSPSPCHTYPVIFHLHRQHLGVHLCGNPNPDSGPRDVNYHWPTLPRTDSLSLFSLLGGNCKHHVVPSHSCSKPILSPHRRIEFRHSSHPNGPQSFFPLSSSSRYFTDEASAPSPYALSPLCPPLWDTTFWPVCFSDPAIQG